MTADWEFGNFQDKSNWKLSPEVFTKLQKFVRNEILPVSTFCIPDVSSIPSLYGLEARSGRSGNECHVSTMGKNVAICLSFIHPKTSGIAEAKERRNHNDIGGTNMAITSIVFSSSEYVYPKPTFIATSERPTSGHIRKNSSFGSKRNFKTGSLVGFCKSLASKGISGKAAKLISDSRRENTISSYESAWCQWAGWCGKQKIDPFRCPLKFASDYLSDIFEKGQAYRTINVHKSAISAYHEPLHGFPIVQSPLVCSLLGGVFNHRPPQLLKKLFVI